VTGAKRARAASPEGADSATLPGRAPTRQRDY